jgi:hypothetical protein
MPTDCRAALLARGCWRERFTEEGVHARQPKRRDDYPSFSVNGR